METKKGGIFYGWWIVVVCTLIMATFFTLLLSCISLLSDSKQRQLWTNTA